MKEALFLLVGGVVGFDLAIGYSWWTLRRANRSVSRRVGQYTGTDLNRTFDELPKSEQKRLMKDWMRIT